ncbi:uncharacterized protein LOC129976333 [Argiope bruennichi]|uniref:uncharacterized protein LOC129976333 n=1 Tax=Argiope bruennichi TaxID=94029 RepID=UPI002494880C|nr:uncharacterized protein LOC129976333 [Argiope bruennichi]
MSFRKKTCLLKLKEKVTTYENINIEVTREENPFIVAVMTLIMKRSRRLTTYQDIKFDDATGSCVLNLYLLKSWNGKELWCFSFRDEIIRGHITNIFSEITIRLFKNEILS